MNLKIMFGSVSPEEVKKIQEDDLKKQKRKAENQICSNEGSKDLWSTVSSPFQPEYQNPKTSDAADKESLEKTAAPETSRGAPPSFDSGGILAEPKRNPPKTSEIAKSLPANQRQMLDNLLKMDEAQIAKMPPEIQKKVYALKSKMSGDAAGKME